MQQLAMKTKMRVNLLTGTRESWYNKNNKDNPNGKERRREKGRFIYGTNKTVVERGIE